MADRSAAPDHVLFDLDGTLIDSIPLILESFRYTLRTHLGARPRTTCSSTASARRWC